jgi:hypothetical protein
MKQLLFLLASLGFGALFGRYTFKSLWWAAAIPTVAGVVLFILIPELDEQPQRRFEAFNIVGPYLVGASLLCGVLSYFSARITRTGIRKSAMNLIASLSARKTTMYLVILLIVASITIELWRKYFA